MLTSGDGRVVSETRTRQIQGGGDSMGQTARVSFFDVLVCTARPDARNLELWPHSTPRQSLSMHSFSFYLVRSLALELNVQLPGVIRADCSFKWLIVFVTLSL